jgi:hypothetical protein
MHDGALPQADAAPARVASQARMGELRMAARECRRLWRWHWERFWMLRWENALRRPSWRVEEEQRAWRRMRAEVRRYAQLRSQIATVSSTAGTGAGTHVPLGPGFRVR